MPPEVNDEDKELLQKITGRFDSSTKARKEWEKRAKRYYGLYRNFQGLKDDLRTASSPRDRDLVLYDSQRTWGAGLHIPHGFSTVETQVARMFAQPLKMLVKPRDESAAENVENMRMIVEAQQRDMGYSITNQLTAKNGLILNLGVQKIGWNKKHRKQKYLTQATMPNDEVEYVVKEKDRCLYDDPFVQDVHPLDFFWDPMASSIESAEYVIHRSWRTTEYVKAMFAAETWVGMEEEKVQEREGAKKYDESRDGFRDIDGDAVSPRKDIHEVWEYHDGESVATILNREVVVRVRENPYWHGELPFAIYRPTIVPGQFVGIGAIEMLEHLILEMNTLRSQRRDNAQLVLQRTFAYQDGMIDPDDLDFSPGMAVPVTGDPREVLFQIPVSDIPASGYQEEQVLLQDIERVSGQSDATQGATSQGDTTATEIQTVHASQNARVRRQLGNMEEETITRACTQVVFLNQQHIVSQKSIPVEEPEPGQRGKKWTMKKVGPPELRGDFDISPDGGSSAQENIPQKRQDGQMLWQMFANNPGLDQRQLAVTVLEKLGVDRPEDWMKPPDPSLESLVAVLRETGETMAMEQSDGEQEVENPFDEEFLSGVIQQALRMDEEKAQAGPPQQGPPS